MSERVDVKCPSCPSKVVVALDALGESEADAIFQAFENNQQKSDGQTPGQLTCASEIESPATTDRK